MIPVTCHKTATRIPEQSNKFLTSTSGRKEMSFYLDCVTVVDVFVLSEQNIAEYVIVAWHISIIIVRSFTIALDWETGKFVENSGRWVFWAFTIRPPPEWAYSSILTTFLSEYLLILNDSDSLTYRMWFFLFVMCIAINCSFTLYFACYCIAIEGLQLMYVLGLMEALVFCSLGWILTCTSVSASVMLVMSLLLND